MRLGRAIGSPNGILCKKSLFKRKRKGKWLLIVVKLPTNEKLLWLWGSPWLPNSDCSGQLGILTRAVVKVV